MAAKMSKDASRYYAGGHRHMMGGAPVRLARLPTGAAGRDMLAQSSRDMCNARPPRGKKEFAQWEKAQLAAYKAADKLGSRSIDDVVAPRALALPVPTQAAPEPQPGQPVAMTVAANDDPRPTGRRAAMSHLRAPSISAPLDQKADPVKALLQQSMRQAVQAKGFGMIVGYARVSSVGQSLDIQVEALEAAGAEKVFAEKRSGTKADGRKALTDAIDFCREGDILICTRLDRFARSQADLHALIEKLAAKGVGFRCLSQPSIDTTTPMGKLLIGVLGAVAEFETELRKERQREGIDKAKAAGVYTGRKKAIDDDRIRALKADGMGAAEIARMLGIHRASVYRALEDA